MVVFRQLKTNRNWPRCSNCLSQQLSGCSRVLSVMKSELPMGTESKAPPPVPQTAPEEENPKSWSFLRRFNSSNHQAQHSSPAMQGNSNLASPSSATELRGTAERSKENGDKPATSQLKVEMLVRFFLQDDAAVAEEQKPEFLLRQSSINTTWFPKPEDNWVQSPSVLLPTLMSLFPCKSIIKE